MMVEILGEVREACSRILEAQQTSTGGYRAGELVYKLSVTCPPIWAWRLWASRQIWALSNFPITDFIKKI